MAASDQALADLTDISSQVEAAVLFDAKGSVAATTVEDPYPFVRLVQDLFAGVEEARAGRVSQLEAATDEGSVFVVRDGERYIAAVTRPEPTVALVFYDLKTALRAAGAGDEQPKPRRKRAPKKTENGDADA